MSPHKEDLYLGKYHDKGFPYEQVEVDGVIKSKVRFLLLSRKDNKSKTKKSPNMHSKFKKLKNRKSQKMAKSQVLKHLFLSSAPWKTTK